MTDDARPSDQPFARARRRGTAVWHRASRPRRLALVAAAVAAAAALVTTVGLVEAPRYSSAAALDGVVGDDLRHEPVPWSWTLTPADVGVPADQGRCLLWQAEPAVGPDRLDGDVLVSAGGAAGDDGRGTSAATDVGADCRFDGGFGSTAQAVSRLARVDPVDGTVRWWVDLGTELDAGSGFVQVWPADGATDTALVSTLGFGGDGFASSYARLDLGTGELTDVTTSPNGRARLTDATASWALVSSDPQFSYQDSRVYYDAEPGTGEFSLYAADDLDTPVWTGETTGSQDEALTPDGLLVLDGGTITAVDGRTGETHDWGPDLPTATTLVVDGDLVVVGLDPAIPTSTDDTDGTVVALSLDGRELWRHGFRQDRGVQATGDCLVFSTTPGVVCVDRRTGAELWTTPPRDRRHGLARVTTDPAGDRGSLVFAQTFEPGGAAAVSGDLTSDEAAQRTVRLLDAASGHEVARAVVPGESQIALVGRTTGYATTASSGRTSTVTAFDLADGRRLWQLDTDRDQLGFWGGTLVANHPDGSVQRLVDPVRLVEPVRLVG
ncbi:PQQ-binding-like beta-propeller repeat protein [Frigoribacterium sp. NPDC087798]|uniref:outer membrane protein assembly factor BamB family protein n=1 Tax=Frigoribacterium sp. NPDC087798 TaxID=3363993 RepID=UPI003814349B